MRFRVDFLSVTSDCMLFLFFVVVFYFVCCFFFTFLSFAESFVVEQQVQFGVDFIHISLISDVKVQC